MYQYIHKMHHENSGTLPPNLSFSSHLLIDDDDGIGSLPFLFPAPFSIAGEYAHPVEQMILGVGTVIGPCLFAKHVTTVYLWMIVRLFQVVDCHSGYDFPWSLNRFLPFYGGAEYHDFHHETFVRLSVLFTFDRALPDSSHSEWQLCLYFYCLGLYFRY